MTNDAQAPQGQPQQPAPQVATQAATPPPPRPDAVPTAVYLSAEGVQGNELIAYDLNKQGVYLVLDGQRLKKTANGNFAVPMADGSKGKIKVKAFIPGRPTITLNERVLYKAPKAPAMDIVAFVVAMFGAAILGWGWFGWLIAALAAFGAGIGGSAWLRNANNKAVPRIVLIVGGLVAGALGILGVWIASQVI